MLLTIDHILGTNSKDLIIFCSDEKMATSWLSKLDGKKHTLLSLERQDGWQLLVGGGPEKYIITLSNESTNLTFHNPAGDSAKKIDLCAGGQYGEFSDISCANFQQAVKTISLFFIAHEKEQRWD